MIIESITIDSSFVLGDFRQSEQEAEKKSVGNNVFCSPDAGMALQKMVGFCCEDDDGGRECPEETKDKLFFDVGINQKECEQMHAHGPG